MYNKIENEFLFKFYCTYEHRKCNGNFITIFDEHIWQFFEIPSSTKPRNVNNILRLHSNSIAFTVDKFIELFDYRFNYSLCNAQIILIEVGYSLQNVLVYNLHVSINEWLSIFINIHWVCCLCASYTSNWGLNISVK